MEVPWCSTGGGVSTRGLLHGTGPEKIIFNCDVPCNLYHIFCLSTLSSRNSVCKLTIILIFAYGLLSGQMNIKSLLYKTMMVGPHHTIQSCPEWTPVTSIETDHVFTEQQKKTDFPISVWVWSGLKSTDSKKWEEEKYCVLILSLPGHMLGTEELE